MAFIWLCAGVLVVSATYFIFGDSVNPWPGLHAAEVAAMIYFLALVVYSTRPPFPRKSRIVSLVLAVVFVGSTAFFSSTFEKTTTWQKSQLLKILSIIQTGILTSQMHEPLMATLNSYYHNQTKPGKTIAQVFRDVEPGAIPGKDIYKPGYEGDSLHIYVATLSDDEIVLVGQPSWGSGKDSTFRNFNGKAGLLQMRATLTAKGVTYGSDN